MNEVSFWADTLRADVFWQALSSIVTFAAVLVAIIVPYAQSQIRIRRSCKLVVAELMKNREALDGFEFLSRQLHHFRQGDQAELQVNVSSLEFFSNAAVGKISDNVWAAVWTEIPAERVACYKQAYDLFVPVLEPERFVSFGGDHLVENQVAMRLQEVELAKKRFDKLHSECSFFRV